MSFSSYEEIFFTLTISVETAERMARHKRKKKKKCGILFNHGIERKKKERIFLLLCLFAKYCKDSLKGGGWRNEKKVVELFLRREFHYGRVYEIKLVT